MAIHPFYVLASANCLTNMTGLYILQESSMISLYQVYLYTQQAESPVAVIQTITRMPTTTTCFQAEGGLTIIFQLRAACYHVCGQVEAEK